MPVFTLDELPSLLMPNQTLLGIDNGQKHIGIAISDPTRSLATPLTVIERGKFSDFLPALERLMKERNVGGLIIGLPLQLDGSTGAAAQSARTLASNLDKTMRPAMCFWDERFSTAVIQRQLTKELDMSRAKRAKVVDKLAASYILQGALDYLSYHR